jgi:mono/diheme cytochrome c family protein
MPRFVFIFLPAALSLVYPVARAGIAEGLPAYENEGFETAPGELAPFGGRGRAHVDNPLGVTQLHGVGTPAVPGHAFGSFTRAAAGDATTPVPVPQRRPPKVPSPPPAIPPGEVIQRGKDVFLRFCAGCHGFDGFASYPPAPSFAMGERLLKSDRELMHAILEGRNMMPSWKDKLSFFQLEAALAYLRYMAEVSNRGATPLNNAPPARYYRFWPLNQLRGGASVPRP